MVLLCVRKLTINVVRPNYTSKGYALPIMLNIYGYVLSIPTYKTYRLVLDCSFRGGLIGGGSVSCKASLPTYLTT